MVKTQVQIPDHLYREAKRIAAQYEMSLAEVVRRALERIVPSYPPRSAGTERWQLPTLRLGLKGDPFSDPDWREDANLSSAAARLLAEAHRRAAERLDRS